VTEYIGRFAPSPTGPLHFGSLVAAVASYLQARANDGTWLLRIEDIDPPREPAGAKAQILTCLHAHGFEFAEPVYQSKRLDRYAHITASLLAAGLAYPCVCTRQQIRATAPRGRNGPIYPGTCRRGVAAAKAQNQAVRLRTNDTEIVFDDPLQGHQSCRLESESGDFLIRRGDGLVSYQLAVALDDHAQGITEVVRGTDLMDTTFCQLHMMQVLGYELPNYMHIPIVLNEQGIKLAKQTGAAPVNSETATDNIYNSLVFLKQCPPIALRNGSISELWNWAVAHWQPKQLAGLRSGSERVSMG
jgi:glutamyl-Q tRNA(Asp) synthetase